jgi:ubiquinone/menaquinone biosynthesis C-methylase UbiE
VNVDKFPICEPDIVWDLDVKPWTWAVDESFDLIVSNNVFEHLTDWWGAFNEVTRILKKGGTFKMIVAHPSNIDSGNYRDGMAAITPYSFWGTVPGVLPVMTDANAMKASQELIPMKCIKYFIVPYKQYNWMAHFPFVLNFVARHMRGFVWSQNFEFVKI